MPLGVRISLEIGLKPRHLAVLRRLVAAVSNPASPLYRHYLAKGQFTRRFGPTREMIAKVRRQLRLAGLRPGRVSANRLLLPVSTTVKGAEVAFGIKLRRYRLPSRAVSYANTAAPRVQRSIAGNVVAIVGLDGLAQPAPIGLQKRGSILGAGSRSRGPRTAADTVPGQAVPCTAASGTPRGSASLWTADEIAQAYGFDPLYGTGDFGAGQSVAVAEISGFPAGDVATYQKCYGTHVTVAVVPVDGGNSNQTSGFGPGEADGDIEGVIGLAPDLASVLVYEAPDSPQGELDDYSQIQSNDAGHVVSSSLGLCESVARANGLTNMENDIFWAMALQGQTVFAASGDDGSEECSAKNSGGATPPPSVERELAVLDPSAQPYVTGVGGTNLDSVGTPPGWAPSETGWTQSGGGISSLWPAPVWQSSATPGVRNSYTSGSPCGLYLKGTYCREVPDVSAEAGQCVAQYATGGWQCGTGTSYAAPIWAALTALIDDSSASCRKTPVGFLNPALYKLAVSTPADFNDITSGDNDRLNAHSGAYPATPGYDMVTGLGSPEGANLAQSLCRLSAPLWTPQATAANETSTSVGTTTLAPAVAWLNGTLYDALVYAPFVTYGHTDDGTDWVYPSNSVVQWSGGIASTSDSPAIAIVGTHTPAVAWTDDSTGEVEVSELTGATWSDPVVVGAGKALSSSGPALASYGNDLFVAWRGYGGTNVFLSINTGSGWSDQIQVPGASTSARPAIAFDPGLDSVVVAWTTSAGAIRYEVYSLFPLTFGFAGSGTIPGLSSDGPALTTLGEHLVAAWKGTGSREQVFYSIQAQTDTNLFGSWGAQQILPQALTYTSPALASEGPTIATAWTGACAGPCSLYYSLADPRQ